MVCRNPSLSKDRDNGIEQITADYRIWKKSGTFSLPGGCDCECDSHASCFSAKLKRCSLADAMGKRRGAFSGLARFLKQSNEGDAVEQSESEVRPAKKRKTSGNDAPGSLLLKNSEWIQNYDASGMVPHYTHASEVPEHLLKCPSCFYFFSDILGRSASTRFCAADALSVPILIRMSP
jgi:hypothetical protein